MTIPTTLHARLADNLADIPDPGGMGTPLWADALAWLTLICSGLAGLWLTALALAP